jgi:sortase A
MLLRVGLAMMLFAVVLAAVVVVVVNFSGFREPAAPGEPRATETPETPSEEPSQEQPAKKPSQEPSQESEVATLPIVPQDWPQPSQEEVAATEAPRYYTLPRDSALSLTVNAIGLYDVPVISSNDPAALDQGVIHVPQTPMPWEQRPQKNVYLAGHRLGYPGTGSRLVFYNLNKLTQGDSVILKDGAGDTYEYRVSEVFVVEPDADWVVDPVRNRDMVTLQTCTMPDFKNRIVVRADRV